jgi:drug/metabolite transporter (DMT)-like permease
VQERSRNATAPRADALGGIAAVVVGIVVLSLGSTIVKWSGATGSVVAFWRLVVGAGIWFAVLGFRRVRITAADLRRTVPVGMLFGFNISLFFTGVRLTRVANVEFIGTLSPVLVVPAAALLLGERVRGRIVGAGLVALAGVAIVLLGSPKVAGDDNVTGDLLAAGAVLTWSLYLLGAKRIRQTMDTKVFMAGMTLGAIVGAAPVAIGSGDLAGLDGRGWLTVGILAVLSGTVAHGCLTWAQRHLAVSTIAMMQLAQPGLATLWAFLVLDESIAAVQVAGMALVVVGVGAIAVESSRPRSRPDAAPRRAPGAPGATPVVAKP